MAALLAETYRPLVEVIVLDHEGKLLGNLSMNQDILKNYPEANPPSEELEQFFVGYLEKFASE